MEYILKAEGICRTYHTGTVEVHALKKCDINIKKGEFTAIVGKSGSGKSTLLRILGTLDKPDEGNVCIDGINIAELKDRQLSKFRRENIGYIYPIFSRLNFDNCLSLSSAILMPSIHTLPSSGLSSVPNILKSVDLPEPLFPTIAVNSPFLILMSHFFNACTSTVPV